MKYITGYQALNISNDKGQIADWHSLKFDPCNIYFSDSTKSPLKNKGIEKRYIQKLGEYLHVANFPRALADMIMDFKNINEFYNCRNDYLSDEEEKELWDYLQEVRKHKDIEDFLKFEFTKFYFQEGKKNGKISRR